MNHAPSSMSRALLVAVLAALPVGVVGAALAHGNPDPVAFAAAGRQLLSGDGLHVFATPYLQVGPLYLLAEGLVGAIARGLGLDPLVTLSVFWSGAVLACITMIAGTQAPATLSPSARQYRRLAAVAMSAALPLPLIASTGHFEEVVTALALVMAALMAIRGRPALVGLLVFTALGVKAWGVLGLPLVLLLPGWRARGQAVAATVVAGLVVYAPFAVGGRLATGEHVWHVATPSVVSLVLAPGTAFGAVARCVQAAVVVVVVAVAATRCRRAGSDAVAVVAVLIAARLATDPYPQSYYVAPLLVVLVLAALGSSRELPAAAITAGASALGADLAFAMPGSVGSVLQLAACVAVITAYYRLDAQGLVHPGERDMGRRPHSSRVGLRST